MIISLVAILMLLFDETVQENEIEWFFPIGDNKGNDKFETKFLGWKMGSGGGISAKGSKKNKSSEPDREKQTETPDFSFLNVSSPAWKTLILADSTIHYIPLEEMATVKEPINSFIPEDAIDPFYLETDSQPEVFNHEFFNSPYVYKVPTQIPSGQFIQKSDLFAKTNPQGSMFCPLVPPYQKKSMPLPDPIVGVVQQPMNYQEKPKIEPGLLPEMNRHTMFIHPKLLGMMKAMDRSILSFPSKFEYKSLDQIGKGVLKRLPSNRYNENRRPIF